MVVGGCCGSAGNGGGVSSGDGVGSVGSGSGVDDGRGG